MKQLKLFYTSPAENSDKGWEEQSMPIGNGYLGANVFGRYDTERVQITENSLENPGYTDIGMMGGLTDFAEIYIDFNHENVTDYERGLDIENAVSYVKYNCDGVHFEREYFASHPSKILAMRFTADKPSLNCKIRLVVPFIKEYALEPNDGGARSGKSVVSGDTIEMSGVMDFYSILYCGVLKVASCDGKVTPSDDGIIIENATELVIHFAVGTNYEIAEHVFVEENPKLKLPQVDPMPRVREYIKSADRSYDELKAEHIKDYKHFFGRVGLSIGDDGFDIPTNELIKKYADGEKLPYLETLYFQFGRYLLICSSRKGCLPPNLQGIWNCHDLSPWGSGYWHNINIQMNYWHAFSTNLAELFESYCDYFKAFLPKAKQNANEYIKEYYPQNYTDKDGENGWCIGTGAYSYSIQAPGLHSGPGTGGLTTKLFWDYYDFTRDKNVLCDTSYPAIKGMAKFLTKTVKKYDDFYLTAISASPEQTLNGNFLFNCAYYQTVGCSFDQQMTYENGKDFLRAAEILGDDDETVRIQREQIDKYDPIKVGWSGQIKEYREEKLYGEIGEYNHRHISQLMSLMPGSLINSDTPAWMDAAKFTLTERTDESTGWALANRFNAWARTGDGEHSYKIYRNLLSKRTLDNLWDTHPPFQIDGNFGGCAGVAEMLLQSHEGYIHILPSLPKNWADGEVFGLCARGAFEVDIDWKNGVAEKIVVRSKVGETAKIKYPLIGKANVENADVTVINDNLIEFETIAGGEYVITGFTKFERPEKPQSFVVDKQCNLSWKCDLPCNIYRAFDGAPTYELIAENVTENSYFDTNADFDNHEIITYRVAAVNGNAESLSAHYTVNHATELQLDILRRSLEGKNTPQFASRVH